MLKNYSSYLKKISNGLLFFSSFTSSLLFPLMLQTEEVKTLWKTANTGGPTEAALALEALMSLVRINRLPAPATLQNFLADVTSAK